MTSRNPRNTKAVALLVLSMTAGAALLLGLETPAPGWAPSTLLMAESGGAVRGVLIEFAGPGDGYEPSAFDCIVYANGDCAWQPRGQQVRLLVAVSDEHLPDAQARALLAVLGNLHQAQGLSLSGVALQPESDARLDPDLPAAAHELRDLLVRKAIIQ